MKHIATGTNAALAGGALVLALAGCTSSIGDAATQSRPTTESSLAWGPCTELQESIENFTTAVGVPLGFEEFLPQLECATVSVPLNYDDPTGRQIDIAVSRTVPDNGSDQVVLTNPGGPGLEGRTMPATMLASPLAEISENMVVVGVDVRGTGASSPVDCPALNAVDPLDENGNEIAQQDYAKNLAAANEECFESDPEYFKQITTQNAAKDLDQVRQALGVDETDFLAGSWGTELGMSYLAQFPDNTHRMLLDSVSDPIPDAIEIYATVAEATQRNASEVEQVDEAEEMSEPDVPQSDDTVVDDEPQSDASMSDDPNAAELPEGPIYQPMSLTAKLAYTCNGVTNAADEKIAWDAYQKFSEKMGGDDQRIAHPISSDLPGIPACIGWPNEPTPIEVTASNADIQLIGHAYETVTPVEWAKKAHEIIGGNLTIIDDDVHSSALTGAAAPQVVRFILDGTPMTTEIAQSGD